jgi:hypothetical protein
MIPRAWSLATRSSSSQLATAAEGPELRGDAGGEEEDEHQLAVLGDRLYAVAAVVLCGSPLDAFSSACIAAPGGAVNLVAPGPTGHAWALEGDAGYVELC